MDSEVVRLEDPADVFIGAAVDPCEDRQLILV